MNNWFLPLIVLIAVIIIAGVLLYSTKSIAPGIATQAQCERAGGQWLESFSFGGTERIMECIFADQTSCESVGGQWTARPDGIGRSICLLAYPDAGQSCSSSRQCAGGCLVERDISGNAIGQGRCRDTNNPFPPGYPTRSGCFSFVEGDVRCFAVE